MKKNAKTKSTSEFVIDTINRVVHGTGYPVTSQTLAVINVDRAQLRHLERQGLLKSVELVFRGQLIKGYYTDKVWPEKLSMKEPALTKV